MELKQSRNLEEGAAAEATEGAVHWLVPQGLLNLCSYRTQDHQLRDRTTYNGLGPSHQSLVKKMAYRLAHSLIVGLFSAEAPSLFSMTLACQYAATPASKAIPCQLDTSQLNHNVSSLVNPQDHKLKKTS